MNRRINGTAGSPRPYGTVLNRPEIWRKENRLTLDMMLRLPPLMQKEE